MLIALVLMALLAVIGSSTLTIAGIDHRIAVQNRKHMMVLNTSSGGNEHARDQLRWSYPASEGYDSADTGNMFVQASESTEADGFEGPNYTHNLGVYWVRAIYHRCGSPPPGYSAEIGSGFRSDYWEMSSTARMQDASFQNINETMASTSTMVRRVMQGACKMR